MRTFQSQSISSATGGTQICAPRNPARNELILHNLSSSTWYINPLGGTAGAGLIDNIPLSPGATLVLECTNSVSGKGTPGSQLTILES